MLLPRRATFHVLTCERASPCSPPSRSVKLRLGTIRSFQFAERHHGCKNATIDMLRMRSEATIALFERIWSCFPCRSQPAADCGTNS